MRGTAAFSSITLTLWPRRRRSSTLDHVTQQHRSAPASLLTTTKSRTTMKAFLIDRYGKNPGRIGEAPAPADGANDVLIEVHASSINVLDSKIRKGDF
jgi:hypothetical protein